MKACLPTPPESVAAGWDMVVLRPDALLYATPGGDGAFQPGTHTTAHLLREADGWAEVEIGDALGCYFDPAGLVGLKLRLWVPVAGLAPVVQQTTTLTFPDRTALTLRAGMALRETDTPGTWRLVDNLATPEVVLPDGAVGDRYREDWLWHMPMELALRPGVMAQGAQLNGAPLPMRESRDPWMWGRQEDDARASFASFCARYTTTLPAGAVDPDAVGGLLFGVSAPRGRGGAPVAPGR